MVGCAFLDPFGERYGFLLPSGYSFFFFFTHFRILLTALT
jgi:hypothetical protein